MHKAFTYKGFMHKKLSLSLVLLMSYYHTAHNSGSPIPKSINTILVPACGSSPLPRASSIERNTPSSPFIFVVFNSPIKSMAYVMV